MFETRFVFVTGLLVAACSVAPDAPTDTQENDLPSLPLDNAPIGSPAAPAPVSREDAVASLPPRPTSSTPAPTPTPAPTTPPPPLPAPVVPFRGVNLAGGEFG